MLIKECLTHDILSCLRSIEFEGKATVAEAINLGWTPDVDDAIERYYTVCAELKIGDGYAEHLVEAHPYEEVVEALAPTFVYQAECFLADSEIALIENEMTIEETTLSEEACDGLAKDIGESRANLVHFNNKTLLKEDGMHYIPDVTISIGSACIRGRLTFPNLDLGIHLIAFYSMAGSKTKEEARQWYKWAEERVKNTYYLKELKEILSGDVPSKFNP